MSSLVMGPVRRAVNNNGIVRIIGEVLAFIIVCIGQQSRGDAGES